MSALQFPSSVVMAPPIRNDRPSEYARALIPMGPLARLTTNERDFVVHSLKRRDRDRVVNVLTEGAKRARLNEEAPLRVRVLQSRLPESVRLQIFDELGGGHTLDKYVQWVVRALRLPLGVYVRPPWTQSTRDDIERATALMDQCVTGHDAVKREVLTMVCQSRCGGTGTASYALGLEGPPGTGKTHFVRTALAPALGLPVVSIPLGGACDLSYLLGNVYTYEGSREGRLASGLIEVGCCNPIVYFDEVDKLSSTERGREIEAALIHLVDPSSNGAMRDRYFHGIDLDFRRVTFVFSYNDVTRLSPVLLDRIKRVRMPTPSDHERADIVRRHLIPRSQARLNTSFELAPGAIDAIVARSVVNVKTGMRGAERDVDHVLSAAQLCMACAPSENDGRLAGVPGVRVLDDEMRVSATFVERSLATIDLDRVASPCTTSMMYT